MHSNMPIVRMIAWIMLTWICDVSSGVFMGRAIEAHAHARAEGAVPQPQIARLMSRVCYGV